MARYSDTLFWLALSLLAHGASAAYEPGDGDKRDCDVTVQYQPFVRVCSGETTHGDMTNTIVNCKRTVTIVKTATQTAILTTTTALGSCPIARDSTLTIYKESTIPCSRTGTVTVTRERTHGGGTLTKGYTIPGQNNTITKAITVEVPTTIGRTTTVTDRVIDETTVTRLQNVTVTQDFTTTIFNTILSTRTVTMPVTISITATKDVTVTSDITITIDETITKDIFITKNQTFTKDRPFTVTNTVTQPITQELTLTKDVTVTKDETLTVTNTITTPVTKDVTITKDETITITNTITTPVTKDVTIAKDETLTVTNTVTQSITDTVTQSVTDTVTQSVTNTVTQSITNTVTQSVTDTVTQSITDTVTQSVTDTVTQSITKDVTDYETKTVTVTETPPPVPTATCSTDGYEIANNDLYSYEFKDGMFHLIKSGVGSELGLSQLDINGMGYNPTDNTLYAMNALANNNGCEIIAIGGDGSAHIIGKVSPCANYNVGDVDADGQFWITQAISGGAWPWAQVVLKKGSSTYGKVVSSGTTTPPSSLTTDDWSYVPNSADNVPFLYSVGDFGNGPALVRWSTKTHDWEEYRVLPASYNSGVACGPDTFASKDGFLYTLCDSHTLWKIPVATTGDPVDLGVGPDRKRSDGARCILV